jgi:hypothetical protein
MDHMQPDRMAMVGAGWTHHSPLARITAGVSSSVIDERMFANTLLASVELSPSFRHPVHSTA